MGELSSHISNDDIEKWALTGLWLEYNLTVGATIESSNMLFMTSRWPKRVDKKDIDWHKEEIMLENFQL